MTHILKNNNLEIHIDAPLENYNFSRFDWTGKIVAVKFKNILFSTTESKTDKNQNLLGKGFYNEFGFDSALGFEDATMGQWFHKIGVGALKKDNEKYLFYREYKVRPAQFKVISESNKIFIDCKSELINGYAYLLKKEIELHENGFSINYTLENTGNKDIVTDEYTHNFAAINNDCIGRNYVLKFPFQIKPLLFKKTVNPEQKVEIGSNEIKFNDSPNEDFFFSNISGSENVNASWELINLKSKIGIRETGNFQTNKINLWGINHVICPELFFKINIKPGQSSEWTRNYKVFTI